MTRCVLTRLFVALASLALPFVSAGCGRARASLDRFVPKVEAAREAVAAALTAWRSGEPPGRIGTRSPPVQVVDTHRPAGQTLKDYEILGEAAGDGPRSFLVRLRLDNPDEERRVRYVVIGIDSLWVFHEDDFTMIAHWDHSMVVAVGFVQAARANAETEAAPAVFVEAEVHQRDVPFLAD